MWCVSVACCVFPALLHTAHLRVLYSSLELLIFPLKSDLLLLHHTVALDYNDLFMNEQLLFFLCL